MSEAQKREKQAWLDRMKVGASKEIIQGLRIHRPVYVYIDLQVRTCRLSQLQAEQAPHMLVH